MTLTMLDTNIVSDLIRNPVGRIAARLLSRGDADLCVSIITACELHFGAAKIASPRMKARVEGALDTVEVVDFKSPAHLTYAAIRAELTASDNIIGPLDLLIAAHARTLGAILVTANAAEFRRVQGLHVENWLA